MEDDWLEPEENAPELEEIPENEADILNNIEPLGKNKLETIKLINDAKEKSTQRAGLVKNTNDGSVWEEDGYIEPKIPESGIHEFENTEECVCECHERKKRDCMHCYDHPVHLEKKRKMTEKPKTEYDEAKIIELIEADKAKKEKKHWWSR